MTGSRVELWLRVNNGSVEFRKGTEWQGETSGGVSYSNWASVGGGTIVFTSGNMTGSRVELWLRQNSTCPAGTTLSGNQCVGTSYTCPSGYTDNGSNCKKTISYALYQYTCPSGYTVANAGLTTCTKTDPNITADNTSTLDDACNSATPPTGNCSKSISYKYYEYLCQAENSFLEPIKNLNSGLNACNKTDSDKTRDNTGTLDDACNSSTPPVNNCQSTEYTCNSALFKPVYVGGKWVCSPYLCNDDMKCGYGTCDLPTTPSATKYQDIAYNPLGTVNDNKCNGDICDFVVNARVTYCESKQCPKGDDIIEKNKETMIIDDKKFIFEKPIGADIALIYGTKVDKFGNVAYYGTTRNCNTVMATAADTVVVQADEMVDCIDPNDVIIPGVFVDYIVLNEDN
jgi:hypothetical protein